MKISVVYRVLQPWRVPVFERLAATPGVKLHVLHGEGYEGSKLQNYSGPVNFSTTRLQTLRFRMRTRNGTARIPVQIGLWRELKRLSPDVVITEGASHLLGNVTSYIYCRLHRKPLIQWGLGQVYGRRTSLSRKFVDALFFRHVERQSRAAIAYSSRGVDYYRQIGLPAEAVFLAVNTVDTDSRIAEMRRYCEDQRLGYPSPVPPAFKVLFIGALTEAKNVDLLLVAFARLLAHEPSAKLVIIGDGDARASLEALAARLNVADRVEFHGHKSGGIAQYCYDASVMVLPGLGGLAISDALCSGVPVVCHSGDGSEVDLIDERNGAILPDMTAETLCNALVALSRDPIRQAQLRQGALAKIEKQHNIGTYVENMLNAVRYCLSAIK
jgi:glycosyltransferase involved in cell wall biosynthesis